MIIFTYREMKNAWAANRKAGAVRNTTNPHRLLLFYATECGLKALILKRERLTLTIDCPAITASQHNINKLLDYLKAGYALKLKNDLQLSPIDHGRQERKCSNQDLNQIWRYGGRCVNVSDEEIQKSLERVNQWIEEQL